MLEPAALAWRVLPRVVAEAGLAVVYFWVQEEEFVYCWWCRRESDWRRPRELCEISACRIQAFLLAPHSSIVVAEDFLPVIDLFLELPNPYISDKRLRLRDVWSLSIGGGPTRVVNLWSIPWCSCSQDDHQLSFLQGIGPQSILASRY